MEEAIDFKEIFLPINYGHGKARRESLRRCTNGLVALMDADDISRKRRFEKQLEIFKELKNVDIVGSQISEFIISPENSRGIRKVPEKHEKIIEFMKKRCPMNQVSVMFKTEAVHKAGGYIDWYCNEDYYLWLRMAGSGCIFANSPEVLVDVRIGNGMSERRGGWKYFSSERRLQQWMLEHKMINLRQYYYNTSIRFMGEAVIPSWGREIIYKKLRSKEIQTEKKEDVERGEPYEITGAVNDYPPFSVAMCVYEKDNPEWFERALQSVIVEQTVKPNEVVIVVDGPVPDSIKQVIGKYKEICKRGGISLTAVWFNENQGLGGALKAAVETCTNELIARMDSDDISISNRFEQQLNFLRVHPEVSVLGGQIEEFIGEESNLVGKRIVPLKDRQIKDYMKRRCPFNHVAVMFKRSAVLAAGNYQDWFWNEDYYLWIRLANNGFCFANLPIILVCVRVGTDMYKRRGGVKYFRSEAAIQKLMYQKKMINFVRYIINIFARFTLQVLMTNNMREIIFKKLARR